MMKYAMQRTMKHVMLAGTAALMLMLGGCATTIRSDVTTFQQWPAQLQDKSYAFATPAPQDDTLELRAYQNLVRGQLTRLGFNEAPGAPALLVSMRFMTTDIPVQVVEPAFPGYPYGGRFGFYGPHRFGGYYGGPFFGGPFGGFGMPAYDVYEEHRYQRQLQILIASRAGQPLFDVTVRNTSRAASTPALMPALVQSAFEGFPGPNGGMRRVELKQNG